MENTYPMYMKNFIAPGDSESLISLIDDMEVLGLIRHTGFDHDGRLLLSNFNNENIYRILHPYLQRLINIAGDGFVVHDIVMCKYYPGPGMGLHSDQTNAGPCEDSCKFTGLLYLNDNYVGGEIEFPRINFLVKPESTSAILFKQAGEENYHEVKKIDSGERYIFTICLTKEKSMMSIGYGKLLETM